MRGILGIAEALGRLRVRAQARMRLPARIAQINEQAAWQATYGALRAL